MSEALWVAIDAITKPTTMRVWRDDSVPDLAVTYAERLKGVCDVADYRASVTKHGKVPSLWHQAEQALYKTGETTDGNRSPLATRSPADVQLMETMLTLRELVAEFFKDQDKPIPPSGALPAELRHMASEIIRRQTDVDLWTYRIEQLRRLLENHLQAVDRGPKPMRLRSRCPKCKTTHIPIDDPEGNLGKDGKILQLVVRPILTVFRDGLLRCHECHACLFVWWGQEGALRLADEMKEDEDTRKPSDLDETMTA